MSDGETGWTFAPGAREELAERLRCVENLANYAVKATGFAARQHVARHFSPQRYLDGVREIYARQGVAWQ